MIDSSTSSVMIFHFSETTFPTLFPARSEPTKLLPHPCLRGKEKSGLPVELDAKPFSYLISCSFDIEMKMRLDLISRTSPKARLSLGNEVPSLSLSLSITTNSSFVQTSAFPGCKGSSSPSFIFSVAHPTSSTGAIVKNYFELSGQWVSSQLLSARAADRKLR